MNETIKEIPLDELHPFPDHPFGVRDDEAMAQTVESIREYYGNLKNMNYLQVASVRIKAYPQYLM